MNTIRFLKVKLKSLAAEARIIRKEEMRSHGTLRDALCIHRRVIVRSEARATHLAYGFLRGRQYIQLEHKAESAPDWKKVESMVKRYGQAGIADHLNEWRGEKKAA